VPDFQLLRQNINRVGGGNNNYDTYTSFKSLSIADTANFKRGGTYGANLPLTDFYLNKNKDTEEDKEGEINASSINNPYAQQVRH
jgi:hypothetical protein